MPACVTTPRTRAPSSSNPSAFCCSSVRFGSASSSSRTARLYSARSAWARVARTAGPLLPFKRAEVDTGAIDGARHGAAERVDLFGQVPFADAADGRVAAHLAQRFEVLRQQQRAHAHAGRGQRGLGAGVAAADDDATIAGRIVHRVVILGGAAPRWPPRFPGHDAGKPTASCANMRRYAHSPAAGAGSPPARTRPRPAAVPALSLAQDLGWPGAGRCRLAAESLPAAYARCGTLEVPLDPAAPDGPTIELFVARLGGFSAEPRPDPLLLIAGGPGQSTVDFYLQLRGAFEPRAATATSSSSTSAARAARPRASPATCPTICRSIRPAPEQLEPRHRRLRRASSSTTRVSTRLRWPCRTSSACARRSASSSGTSTASRTARASRSITCAATRSACASVVLDGVVPPPLALGPDVAREAQRALEQIFARCAADAGCGARFAALPATVRRSARAPRRRRGRRDRPAADQRARAAHAGPLHELQRRDRSAAARADQRSARRQLRAARGPGAHACCASCPSR